MHDSLDPNSYENNDNTKKEIDPNRSSKGKLNEIEDAQFICDN